MALIPLVAKLERSKVPRSEEEIKKRWHNNLRWSAISSIRKIVYISPHRKSVFLQRFVLVCRREL